MKLEKDFVHCFKVRTKKELYYVYSIFKKYTDETDNDFFLHLEQIEFYEYLWIYFEQKYKKSLITYDVPELSDPKQYYYDRDGAEVIIYDVKELILKEKIKAIRNET